MNRLIAHLIMTPVKAIVMAMFPLALLAITVEAVVKRCRARRAA